MPKITKKMMNKIHNEMRERFGPYWERKSAEIHKLQRAVSQLQKEVQELNEFKAGVLRSEASKGDTGKHVATPAVSGDGRVYRAYFYNAEGNRAGCWSTSMQRRELDRLNVKYVQVNPHDLGDAKRVMLQPTEYDARYDSLEERLNNLFRLPIMVTWARVA